MATLSARPPVLRLAVCFVDRFPAGWDDFPPELVGISAPLVLVSMGERADVALVWLRVRGRPDDLVLELPLARVFPRPREGMVFGRCE